ncbi:LamG domain-containing protein [Candidatus Wolfebacteria bacterium]|nr:LamG domain-containing protein [Candidatus Wolfebacteria bacterium]
MNNKIKLLFLLSILVFSFVFAVHNSFAADNLFNVDANTIALWRFNEINGSTVIDSVGVNNGSVIGTTIVDGKFGKARYFNGQSDYIVVPHNPSLTNFSQITIEAWVYLTGFDLGCWNPIETIVSKGRGDQPNAYSLRIWRNQDNSCAGANSFTKLKFTGDFGGGAIGSEWYDPNQWYYVVFSYDGGYLKLYVNGILEATSNYAPNLTSFTTYPLYIDHHTWSYGYESSQRIQGLIDEIRISNIARSAQEISNYYNQAVPPLNQPPTISNLGQYKSDGSTQIIENAITTDPTVIFKADAGFC